MLDDVPWYPACRDPALLPSQQRCEPEAALEQEIPAPRRLMITEENLRDLLRRKSGNAQRDLCTALRDCDSVSNGPAALSPSPRRSPGTQ